MSGGGNSTPVMASSPIPPPIINAPFVTKGGFLTPTGLDFLQKLWASIAGGGGITENIIQNIYPTGIALAAAGALSEQDPTPPIFNGPVDGEVARLRAEISELRASVALLRASLPRNNDALSVPPTPVTRLNDQFLAPQFPAPMNQLISSSAIPWTPVVAGSTTAGTQTYTTQCGFYVELGPAIFATYDILLASLDGTAAGNCLITGLPIVANNIPAASRWGGWLSEAGGVTFTAGYTYAACFMQAGSPNVTICANGTATGQRIVLVTNLSSTARLTGGILYPR